MGTPASILDFEHSDHLVPQALQGSNQAGFERFDHVGSQTSSDPTFELLLTGSRTLDFFLSTPTGALQAIPDYREVLFLVRQQPLDQRTQIGDHTFVRRQVRYEGPEPLRPSLLDMGQHRFGEEGIRPRESDISGGALFSQEHLEVRYIQPGRGRLKDSPEVIVVSRP